MQKFPFSGQLKAQIVVSAIVSTYRSSQFIRGCLEDLVAQTLYQQGKLEIIVIDSASPENEGEIVQEFQQKFKNIIYERTAERETLYRAWNRGIQKARGRYITSANTDDRRRYDALEVMANYLDAHPDIGLAYGDQLITTEKNDIFTKTKARRRWNWPDYAYEKLRQGCCVGSQPMWRKCLHEEYGYFREDFSCAGDYEFWLRIGSQGKKMSLISQILGLYYLNLEGLEHGTNGQALKEHYQVCKIYDIPCPDIELEPIKPPAINIELLGVILTEQERENLEILQTYPAEVFPIIVVDGVIFQINQGGIRRVWHSILQEWSESPFAEHILVLDRNRTAPRFKNLKYWIAEAYGYNQASSDAQKVQLICDQIKADLFISTYYTTPISTPAVVMVHDMIPEIIRADLTEPEWREKRYGILYAHRYIAISINTAQDLVKFYPQISEDKIDVVYNAVSQDFSPASPQEIKLFKENYQIAKPYFLIVGSRVSLKGYKNTKLFLEAINRYPDRDKVAVVCVGNDPQLEPELSSLATAITTRMLKLDDRELKVAYSGAIALVYPSLYEGFGLPILEAMACGCPVLVCRNSAIPEVAGEAALYLDGLRVDDMLVAMEQIQVPEVRLGLIEKGLQQVKKFSWSKTADKVANILLDTAHQTKLGNLTKEAEIWRDLRKLQEQQQNQQNIAALAHSRIEEMEISLKKLQSKNDVLLPYIQNLQQEINDMSKTRTLLKKLIKIALVKVGIWNFTDNIYRLLQRRSS